MNRNKYFVSYTFINPNGTHGFGSGGYATDEYISSMDGIAAIQNRMAENIGASKVIVLNFILLSTDEDAP